MDLAAHAEMMRDLRARDARIVADGPVVPSRYENVPLRILWVLREVNNKGNEGKGWDLCQDFLANDAELFKYSHWASTYGAVAVLSHALLYNLPVEEAAGLRAKSVVEAIRETAVINVNKYGGVERSTGELTTHAAAFESIVARQLTLLDPHIVISAGTSGLLPEPWRGALARFHGTAIACCRHEPGWLVKSYHTGQTTVSWGELYRVIRGALIEQGWPAQ